MKLIYALIGICIISCKTTELFESREYRSSSSEILEFYPNKSFQYLKRMEGGYVYEYGKGSWKQDGNKVFLFNEGSNPDELSININNGLSIESKTTVVVNILPKKGLHFAHLPYTLDLLDVELVIGKKTYRLTSETNVIELSKPIEAGYFKVFNKSGIEKNIEILHDTLRSKIIDFTEHKNSIMTIDVDCNPDYFAKVKMNNDTLQIINDHKIKWNKIILERPE